MYWQENETVSQVSTDIVDISFSIECKTLPISHSYALLIALYEVLPWMKDEETIGVHRIYIPESGNGWMRSEDKDALFHPSHRTKLILRVPQQKVDAVKEISGRILTLNEFEIKLGKCKVKTFTKITTLYSRYIISHKNESEDDFIENCAVDIRALGIKIKKLLCGKNRFFDTPEQEFVTKSLMLADLDIEESILLQQKGIGTERRLGCGIFIPHKSLTPVNDDK